MSENLHRGHRQRVKRRYLKHGLDGFDDHQILELLLFYAVPQKDTNEIAHELLNRFGSISDVFDAPPDELMQMKNIKENAAVLLKLIPELTRVYMQEKAKPFVRYDTPEKLISFFVPMFVGKTKERLYVAYLDNAGKMLHCSMVAEGFSDLLQIPMQEIIHNAYTYSSKNIVIAHNHPTGLSNPSGNDLLATNNLIKVLKELEMSLIDHIIVGKRSDAISMHNLGYFNDPRDLIWKDGGLDRVD